MIVEKAIMYMPVAELTLGGTPKAISIGLNITPPPRPSAPATQPPPNPRPRIVLSTLPLKIKSLGTRLTFPNFSLRLYSLVINLTET